MSVLVKTLIFCAYVVGLVSSNPTAAFGATIKVKITHSHDISDQGHHHHNKNLQFTGEPTADSGHTHTGHSHDKENVPHSHEVSIPATAPYIIGTGSGVVSKTLVPNTVFPSINNESAPQNFSPGSIFRPPIV